MNFDSDQVKTTITDMVTAEVGGLGDGGAAGGVDAERVLEYLIGQVIYVCMYVRTYVRIIMLACERERERERRGGRGREGD